MGTNLERWAARQEGLSEKNFRVLLAMCMVAHDNTGKFFISVHKFLTDDRYRKIHRMPSHSALRQHYLALVRKGFIGRIRKGNGKLGPKKDKYNTRRAVGPYTRYLPMENCRTRPSRIMKKR